MIFRFFSILFLASQPREMHLMIEFRWNTLTMLLTHFTTRWHASRTSRSSQANHVTWPIVQMDEVQFESRFSSRGSLQRVTVRHQWIVASGKACNGMYHIVRPSDDVEKFLFSSILSILSKCFFWQ